MSKLPLIIVAAAALLFSPPPAAHASTFSFTGVCATGSGLPNCTDNATGTLVLQNYTLGTTIGIPNFVSFTYTSDVFSESLSTGQISSIGGVLDNLPGPASVSIVSSSTPFEFGSGMLPASATEWCAALSAPSRCAPADFGLVWTWSEVPIPAALPLFATGIGAIGLLGWRRKQKARAA
jgi:hypothetical protein